jgi:hypothetical protein
VGNLGAEYLPQALISKELKIIRKVFEEIYTPRGYRGVGVPSGGQ